MKETEKKDNIKDGLPGWKQCKQCICVAYNKCCLDSGTQGLYGGLKPNFCHNGYTFLAGHGLPSCSHCAALCIET